MKPLCNFAVLSALCFSMYFSLVHGDASPVLEHDQEKAQNQQQADLEAAKAAATAWLAVVDKGDYAESWKESSVILKMVFSEKEWESLLKKTRKPLGTLKSREVVFQSTADNPKSLPKGEYAILGYKSAYTLQSTVYEILFLYREEGKWRAVNYEISQKAP